MLEELKGKKTYVVAAGTVVYAILGYLLGYIDPGKAIELILTGSGLAALRAGIGKG